jgi:hypothetical protein
MSGFLILLRRLDWFLRILATFAAHAVHNIAYKIFTHFMPHLWHTKDAL